MQGLLYLRQYLKDEASVPEELSGLVADASIAKMLSTILHSGRAGSSIYDVKTPKGKLLPFVWTFGVAPGGGALGYHAKTPLNLDLGEPSSLSRCLLYHVFGEGFNPTTTSFTGVKSATRLYASVGCAVVPRGRGAIANMA